jgi:hypothetical protein
MPPKRVAQKHVATEAPTPSPSATPSKVGERAWDSKAAHRDLASTQQQPPNAHEAQASRDIPATGGAPNVDGANDDYVAAIKSAILRRWTASHPGADAPDCALVIQQDVGGKVTLAQATHCSDIERRSLEAAALMAQPLPYAGYESRFKTRLNIGFD